MSLIMDNPDWQGIREGFADEEISFWDLPDQPTHFFPNQMDAATLRDANELDALINDFHRVRRQSEELLNLMPHKREILLEQFYDAANEIERKIKKLLGNKVNFTANQNL